MPVPVPRSTRPPAHPVTKFHRHSDPPYPTSVPSLTFARSNGISRSRSWISTKPHRIWEEDVEGLGFCDGLTTAANAHVIKGVRAQACLPPISSLARHPEAYGTNYRHSTGDMTYDTLPYPEDDDADLMQISPVDDMNPYSRNYGAFSPVFEDPSPEPHVEYDPGSSPIGPMTPFGDFIDRAMAENPGHIGPTDPMYPPGPYDTYQDHRYGTSHNQTHSYPPAESPLKQPPASDAASVPCASVDYKRLVDPLSEWLACYIWRVCTTGAGLPHPFFRPSSYPQRYSRIPPPYLAVSIRSLLLSTLLQPSAIYLSLWYVMRLPVYLGPVAFGADYVKETQFRAELLGDNEHIAETHAPFRVFLLGCMLANKWLDDHTFSNKTWHSISNVPVRSLNRLEFYALDNFCHDISISPHQWSQWLSHLLSYHSSLSSPSCPQPISRPSTNPHVIIKKSLDELLQVTITSASSHGDHDDVHAKALPEPVFLGLEERRREKLEKDEAAAERNVDMLDIDLDEDGPLREEYLPKRRVSRSDSERSRDEHTARNTSHPLQPAVELKPINMGRVLPPPAKWSPSGDEPILRDRNRIRGQYVAPQAPSLRAPPMSATSFSDNGYLWAFVPMKHDVPMRYVYGSSGLGPPRLPYDYGYPYDPSHARSHSLNYAQENMQPRLHSRSHSQMPTGYGYGNVGLQESKLGSQPYATEQYGYYGYPFVDESAFNYPRFPLRA